MYTGPVGPCTIWILTRFSRLALHPLSCVPWAPGSWPLFSSPDTSRVLPSWGLCLPCPLPEMLLSPPCALNRDASFRSQLVIICAGGLSWPQYLGQILLIIMYYVTYVLCYSTCYSCNCYLVVWLYGRRQTSPRGCLGSGSLHVHCCNCLE